MLIYSNWEQVNVHPFFKVHTDRSMYIVTRRQLTLTDPHTFFSVVFSYHSCHQSFSAERLLEKIAVIFFPCDLDLKLIWLLM